MRSRDYETVECPSVRPSNCLSHIDRQQLRRAAGLPLSAVRQEISVDSHETRLNRDWRGWLFCRRRCWVGRQWQDITSRRLLFAHLLTNRRRHGYHVTRRHFSRTRQVAPHRLQQLIRPVYSLLRLYGAGWFSISFE